MSWLSGGISSLTDQISTFTKEVISESTQEIEGRRLFFKLLTIHKHSLILHVLDPVTELHLARKRNEEFANQNAQTQEEVYIILFIY